MIKQLLSLSAIALASIGFAQCEDFEINISLNDPTCYEFSDGAIAVTSAGGTGTTSYTITNEADEIVNPGAGGVANILPDGCYEVYAIDEAGCELTETVCLEDPEEMTPSFSFEDCTDGCNGFIIVDTVMNTGGDYAGVSYFWSPDPNEVNGIGGNEQIDICGADYGLTIIDENGCSISTSIYLECLASVKTDELSTLIVAYQNESKSLQIMHPTHQMQVQLLIYTTNGAVVMDQQVNTNQPIVLNTLTKGLYIYQLTDGNNKSVNGKISVQN